MNHLHPTALRAVEGGSVLPKNWIKKAKALQFDVPLTGDNPTAAGNRMQEAIDEYMARHPNEFIASGVVVEREDGLHYVGSQFIGNLEEGQEPDREGFERALNETIDIAGLRDDREPTTAS